MRHFWLNRTTKYEIFSQQKNQYDKELLPYVLMYAEYHLKILKENDPLNINTKGFQKVVIEERTAIHIKIIEAKLKYF